MRASELFCASGTRGRLSWYTPELCQSSHCHRAPHVSILLAGSFRETTVAGERTIWPGQIAFRAADSRHAVQFGPTGALILSVEAEARFWPGVARDGVRWMAAPVRLGRELVALAQQVSAAGDVAERLVELSSAQEQPPGGAAPAWLARAAEQLIDAPNTTSIAALARLAGVHRVHFSRQFARYYHLRPSVFRRRVMAARAVAAALDGGAALSDAAARAGFADESHMARAVRECCGMAPGSIRRLLSSRDTSVQFCGGRSR